MKFVLALACALLLSGCSSSSGVASSPVVNSTDLRIATYNASLNRSKAGELVSDLGTGDNKQAKVIAEIIQTNHPDIMLVNEFDYYQNNQAADLFRKNYLEVGQGGQPPIEYPYAYTAPVNTGVPTGLDIDGDGKTDGPGDAYGFGAFPGQYGMLVLSKYPIDTGSIRTFQNFLWKDMPSSLLPRDYYGQNADILRLSSKSHWDLPVTIGDKTLHVLVSHPTPPSFDGPDNHNGLRNHDEIRLSADYIAGGDTASYIYDDKGVRGGLPSDASFVMLGDQNSDPADGDSVTGSVEQVLELPRVQNTMPTSTGAAQAGNSNHKTPANIDTADFSEPNPGNLRVDYVLPSTDIKVNGSAVFWPGAGEPEADLMPPTTSSDHRLVWVDVTF